MKKLGFIFLMAFSLFSCNIDTSYTLYVRNSIGEDLTIAYKTANDLRGPVEETITLKDGAAETIISTGNLETAKGSAGATQQPCEFVAEYIKFTIRDNIESTLKWCDPLIKLETVDIGQDEFMLDFKLSDFPVE